MATSLTVNGTSYSYPSAGEPAGWGAAATNWASAVTTGMLQKAGGSFTLTAEVDFGGSFGLKSLYYSSRNGSPASAGIVRLGNAEDISWRNNADSADLDLNANSSDRLEFDGNTVAYLSEVQAADEFIEQSDTPANYSGAANQVLKVNSGETAVEFGALVNANVGASAAIALSKLAAVTASRALVSDGSGFVSAATTTAVEIGYVNGVTSAIQTQLDAKAADDLSDLQSVAINTSLISDTNNTDDLGSDSIEWKDLYVHSIKHGDSSNANLSISTTSDNGDVDISAHGTGKVAISSPLEVTGTDTYVKVPTLDTTQRDALTPAAGQLLYNSTTGTIQAYTSSWGTLASASSATATTQGLVNSYIPDGQSTTRAVAAIADFTFVDGDVDTGADTITETAHGLETGDKVQLSTTGVLPTGLSAATDYYVIKTSANAFQLATSLANAEAGTDIDITAASGGGTHTVAHQEEFNVVVDDGYDLFLVTTGTSTLTIPVPSASSHAGRKLTFKKVDSGVGTLSLTGTVDGFTNPTLEWENSFTQIESDGTSWHTIAGVTSESYTTATPTDDRATGSWPNATAIFRIQLYGKNVHLAYQNGTGSFTGDGAATDIEFPTMIPSAYRPGTDCNMMTFVFRGGTLSWARVRIESGGNLTYVIGDGSGNWNGASSQIPPHALMYPIDS